ncbi:MAG: glycosyltransferase [Gemmatimonadota bacterium]
MTDVPVLTVAVCTRDRRALLGRCLDALCALDVPSGLQWEVLVVDNASTDGSRQLALGYGARLPVRVVVEERPGVSSARNRAVGEARGEFILWLDDDALVSPGWLGAYAAAIAARPNDAIMGGPIDLEFTEGLPIWFEKVLPRVAPIFGQRDLGPNPVPLAPRESAIPFGANFATRVAHQRRYVFDHDLGRHPDHPGRGSEETEVMMAMLADGLEGHWVPGARVRHLKGADRLNLEFMSHHIADYGEYCARRAARIGGKAGPRVGGAPLSAWWRYWKGYLTYLATRAFLPVEKWVHSFIEMSEARGWLEGHRRLSRRRQ